MKTEFRDTYNTAEHTLTEIWSEVIAHLLGEEWTEELDVRCYVNLREDLCWCSIRLSPDTHLEISQKLADYAGDKKYKLVVTESNPHPVLAEICKVQSNNQTFYVVEDNLKRLVEDLVRIYRP